ncbi:hypothetical protein [Asticcacaulis machinosus]|uniref:Uncharacterized protein n=1 Tax=Asticcacaulis machinosus TaxID=2984211 RepID=A0ABT5HM89_9CAUL|nr:hypothetical protein [Asticcacaulis machinosus]MDC7677245.1 hypothetical protein [Asticcacaulis machinosus]
MSDFTPLETAVLDNICADYGDFGETLRALLASAKVSERDNTGHGFYTTIIVNKTLPAIAPELARIDGPDAHMLGMGEGMIMGFILWCENGYPQSLEAFQYGDAKGDTIDLKQYDLSALRFSHIEPLLKGETEPS